MNKKYKIGNFTIEINSPINFSETESCSLFSYNGISTDYTISINFTNTFPDVISNSLYETDDRIYFIENGSICCYYKSHEKDISFYACRKTEKNTINILIDEKYQDLLRSDVIFSLTGIEELIIKNNGIVLHASCVVRNNEAVLFTGPCSIGKSTQADLWKRYGDAVIINGDKALITKKNGGFFVEGFPFSGSSKDCLNISAPLKAIICLDKGKENSICRIYTPKSFYSIYRNCYPVQFSHELTNSLIDFVSEISSQIPVYEYSCLPDESSVRFLEQELK